MNMPFVRSFVFTAACVLTASALPAQGLRETAIVTQPTFTSLTFGEGAGKRTVSQFALPIAVILPFGERFNVDVTTAYATSTAKAGTDESSISGLTDTQIRANYRFGEQLLLTVGLNLPTGQYSVGEDQQEAAGQIGNDFLYYPISSMGNGFAATGGIAYARPLGSWNVGFGGSMRKSTEFAAFETAPSTEVRFTPADEYRLQLSADRPVREGQVSMGLTYSAFGEDLAENTTYSTGNRIIGTAGWSFPLKGANVFLSGWNLYRMSGEQFGGAAPPENVFNVSGAVSFDVGKLVVQPSIETRLWQVDGARAGNQFNLGARVRVPVGSLVIFPQVGYTMGNVYSLADGAATKVSGIRLNMTVRFN